MLQLSVITLTMIGLVIAAGWLFCLDAELLNKYSVGEELSKKDNSAVGIRYSMFLLAFVISFWGVVHPSAVSFWEDLNTLVYYAVVVAVVLIASRHVNDKLILSAFDNNKEVVVEKNNAVAVVEGASYLATAWILSSALVQLQSGDLTALIWLVMGQTLLIGVYQMYKFMHKDVNHELDNHNLAVGLAVGGILLSSGILLGAAIGGDSRGFLGDSYDVIVYLALWSGFMAVAHWGTDYFLLPGATIRDELYKDKNPAVGLLQASVSIATTLFYTHVW